MNLSRILTIAMQVTVLFVATFAHSPTALEAANDRQEVKLPPMVREHMLRNMRDHLMALEEITRSLGDKQFDKAAEIAESRLGMSSLDTHGASHMSQFLPQEMGQIGMKMHRAASRFSIAAINAELEGGQTKALSALSEVIQQCVSCHAGYKIQ
jgi:cytochrome c556